MGGVAWSGFHEFRFKRPAQGSAQPSNLIAMFGFKKERHRHRPGEHRPEKHRPGQDQKRFYLFPGMGGRAYRRKRNLILKVSFGVGLFVSAVFALLMWFIHRSPK